MNAQNLAYFGLAMRPDGRRGLLIVRRVRNGGTFKQVSQKFLTPSWSANREGDDASTAHVGRLNRVIAANR